MFTDGSCTANGFEEAAVGVGVWLTENDPRNQAVRLPQILPQSNQTAEFYTISMAAHIILPFAPLYIVSNLKYVVNRLTEHLPS